jgi:hypothetical protein
MAPAESIPGLNRCLYSNPIEDPSSALPFRLSSSLESDFTTSPSGCGSFLDSIFGSSPLGRAAGTVVGATRLMFGVNLDLKKLIEFTRSLYLTPGDPARSGIESSHIEANRESGIPARRSFFLKASRKKILLGLRIQW